MSNPLISICIPAYKKSESLKRLLQSIQQQTFTNYEVIITDDSPDDAVEKLVKYFSAKFSIRYSKNNPAAGVPVNWNMGIKKAAGAWIKMMHDDDWFSNSSSLEKFADAAKKTGNNFIFSACNNINLKTGKEEHELLNGWRKKMLEENPLNLIYLNVVGHPSTVMHRNDSEILYDEQFKWVVDVDFYIRYLTKHPGFKYLPETLINIGIDDTQISNKYYKNKSVELPEYLSMLAKYPTHTLLQHQYVFHLVWNMVKRYKVQSANDIAINGYHGQLPEKLEDIIRYQKKIPRFILKQPVWSEKLMKKCFEKLST